jgi:hypothetical protein
MLRNSIVLSEDRKKSRSKSALSSRTGVFIIRDTVHYDGCVILATAPWQNHKCTARRRSSCSSSAIVRHHRDESWCVVLPVLRHVQDPSGPSCYPGMPPPWCVQVAGRPLQNRGESRGHCSAAWLAAVERRMPDISAVASCSCSLARLPTGTVVVDRPRKIRIGTNRSGSDEVTSSQIDDRESLRRCFAGRLTGCRSEDNRPCIHS